MRPLALWLAFLTATTLAVPVLAQDDLWEETEEEDEGFLQTYPPELRNRFLIGVNSLATFPADPVMSTAEPDAELEELPGSVVMKWPVGFCQGLLLGVYRAGMGALDVLFSPFTFFTMLSPEPRYMLFPNVEHDEY